MQVLVVLAKLPKLPTPILRSEPADEPGTTLSRASLEFTTEARPDVAWRHEIIVRGLKKVREFSNFLTSLLLETLEKE